MSLTCLPPREVSIYAFHDMLSQQLLSALHLVTQRLVNLTLKRELKWVKWGPGVT